MKPYFKTTDDIVKFVKDKSYDFLCTDVRFEEDANGVQSVVFDQTKTVRYAIKPEDNEDDIHQRITKAIWDGLGGDEHPAMDHCVYISASEPMADDFYINVVRTKNKGAE